MTQGPDIQLAKYKAILFDSDGVLVQEGDPLSGAKEIINHLNSIGVRVIVLSNNSTKHPDDMRQNYHSKGLKVDHIVNSSIVTAKYCNEQGIRRVFVVGEVGLTEVLVEHDLIYTIKDVDAVVVGMDRDLTYQKLATATRMIREGARFIGTNPDPSFPTPRGLEPGAGSMIAALKVATGQEPEEIIGKPQKYSYEYVMEQFDLEAKDCLMIGDRFETDIAGAIGVGMPALIVNTGIAATRKDPGKYGDYERVEVIDNLADIIPR